MRARRRARRDRAHWCSTPCASARSAAPPRRPSWFEALHVYVWPALLTLAIAGIRVHVDARRGQAQRGASPHAHRPAATAERSVPQPAGLTRRFVVLTARVPRALHGGVAALSRERRRACGGGVHRPRRGRWPSGFSASTPRATGNVLLDGAGRIPGHAGVHLDAADSGVPGGGLRLRDRVALARAGAPRGGTALCRSRHRPAARRGAAGRAGRFAAVPDPRVLPAAPRRGRRAARGLLASRRRPDGVAPGAARRGPGRRRSCICSVRSYARALTSAFAAGAPLEDPQGAIALLPAFQVGFYVALVVAAFVRLRVAAVRGRPRAARALAGRRLRGAAFRWCATAGSCRTSATSAPGRSPAPLLVVVAMVTYARPRR